MCGFRRLVGVERGQHCDAGHRAKGHDSQEDVVRCRALPVVRVGADHRVPRPPLELPLVL